MVPSPMDPPSADDGDGVDLPHDTGDLPTAYAKDAWLHRRVLDHVDMDVGGGYTWEADEYAPIPVVQDGETGLVFAKT